MRHFCVSFCVFFLVLTGWPAVAHQGHSHDSSEGDVAIQVQEQFLKYLKSAESAEKFTTEAYVTVNGRRYVLNSEFYELLRLSLKAAAPDVCGSCVAEEVKAKSSISKFAKKWGDKVRDLFGVHTVAYGSQFIDEYGFAAGAGYVLMEVLEHTFLGPLGICPILNLYYLSMLDTIKQGQFVFQSAYKQSLGKAVYLAFRSAFESMRLNSSLKHPTFKYNDGAEGEPAAEGLMSWSIFKDVRKAQGRYRWFLWDSWLDERLSRRTLWPSAYMNMDLEKKSPHSHHEHDGHDHAPFKMLMARQLEEGTKPLLKCESTSCNHDDPISEDRLKDIYFIADVEQPQIQRFINASLLQDVLLFEAQALSVQFRAELMEKRADMGAWQLVKKARQFNRLNIKIKKFGATLKALAMLSQGVGDSQKEQSIKNLREILDIFQKASHLREHDQSLLLLLEDIEKLLSCQELLT